MTKYIVPLILIATPSLAKVQKIELTESYFKKLDAAKTPQLQRIELNYLNGKSQQRMLDSQYSYYLTGGTAYGESNEQSLHANVPVTSSNKSAEIGIQKKTKYGIAVSSKYFSQQYTNAFLTDATTNGVHFDIEIDLFKDFLGRSSKADYTASKLMTEEARFIKEIQKKQYINELRKAYWDLVATNEAYVVSKTLFESAKKQLAEQERKFKSGIGSRGDVARFKSLVSDRNSNLIDLESTRSQKIQLLKQQIPELVGKDVSLGSYSLENTVKEFFQCTAIIEKEKTTPMEFTSYDEILKLKAKRLGLELEVLNNYSKPELKLVSQFDVIGNDFNFSQAQSELSSDNSSRYTLAIQMQVPLGNSAKNTEELKVMSAKAQANAEIIEIDAKLHTLHKGIIDNLGHLKQVILNRYENQKLVDIVLKDSKKKYRQARISSKNLIDDEDQKLNNDLALIQVQAEIIAIMLDYFSVFTETPCQLNKI